MGLGFCSFRHGSSSSKCKTEAKMAVARIKLLRNRRVAQVRQMRRDIATLLESGQEETARIRVEHVIREQNILRANEIIELFCELVVMRLSILAKQRDCPVDLKEGISSLIYAAPRCSEIPELDNIRRVFEKKYGRDFVLAATDLRPESGVNRMLIEKLSVRKPAGELKLNILKEIAKEHQVGWDPKLTELELLKPPDEVIEGPRTFASAASMPVIATILPQEGTPPTKKGSSNNQEKQASGFKDPISAAQAAAEFAEKAVSAAQAAAFLAKKNPHEAEDARIFEQHTGVASKKSYQATASSFESFHLDDVHDDSQSFNSNRNVSRDADSIGSDARKAERKTCRDTGSGTGSGIKFDDSDGFSSGSDDEHGLAAKAHNGSSPPTRPPPVAPPCDHNEHQIHNNATYERSSSSCVHPKLPDYDALTARFESLRRRMS